MNTIFGSVAASSFRGSTKRNINKRCKLTRTMVLMALLMAAGTLLICASVEAKADITIAQLNGPWQIALVGNTCGATSMVFTGSLTNGSAPGWLTGNGGCGPGLSPETFTITSLDSHGFGKANLTCASCGLDSSFNFNIQVAPDSKTFSLADVTDVNVNVLAGTAVAQQSGITMDQLAGTWQIALVGNTGCGASSLEFTGTLNTSGTATGPLKGSSTGCPSGTSFQTFTITSLSSSNGSGTANLSCGSGCGWDFDIQVSTGRQTFNLVDVVNGGDGLAGIAVLLPTSTFTVDQLAGPWQISLVGNSGCGQTSMQFTGTLDTSGTAKGTLIGSSTGCPSSSSAQTFTINNPLGPDGTGTASLSCGSGCGWNFAIQVASNKQIFNLVDTGSGDPNFNELAGTAVAKPGFVAVPDEAGNQWQTAVNDIQAAGLKPKLSGAGAWVLTTKPNGGSFVPVGSTVTIYRTNIHN